MLNDVQGLSLHKHYMLWDEENTSSLVFLCEEQPSNDGWYKKIFDIV